MTATARAGGASPVDANDRFRCYKADFVSKCFQIGQQQESLCRPQRYNYSKRENKPTQHGHDRWAFSSEGREARLLALYR